MVLTIGQRLRSKVSTAEVIVVRSDGADVTLTCAGVPMIDGADVPDPEFAGRSEVGGEVLLGKRYEDSVGRVQVLVTKAGAGDLALDGEPLSVTAPRPLPASD
jgi:hypothetical protein